MRPDELSHPAFSAPRKTDRRPAEIAAHILLDKKKVAELTLELREKLAGHPIQVHAQKNHELEMMPFDHLAEMFLEEQ